MARIRLATAALLLLSVQTAARAQLQTPCTSGTATCTQWIEIGSEASRTLVYRTHDLDARNDDVVRALIVVHGGRRNAEDYFRTGIAAALIAESLANTVVVAPRFAATGDVLSEGEMSWAPGTTGVSSAEWVSGMSAVHDARVTSFDVADEILRKLAVAEAFPNLRRITIVGVSAGGQFVNRYAMTNVVHEDLGLPVSYVVASPSTYGYVDAVRPDSEPGAFREYRDARNCAGYNSWPYGLENRTGYSERISAEQIRRQLVERPTTYLVGSLETPESLALQVSCPAMAQGRSRLTRGQAYLDYVTKLHGATHRLIVVPECGHSGRCVLTADSALGALFPKP